MKQVLVGVLALGSLMATAPAVSASPITVFFTGTVDAGSPLFANDTLTGSYTYDTALAARAGSDAANTYYDEITGLDFALRDASSTLDYSGSSSNFEVQLNNEGGVNPDRYAVVAGTGVTGSLDPAGRVLTLFFITMLDSTQTTIADALTTSLNPNLHTFTSREFGLDFTSSQSPTDILSVHGTITGFRVPSSNDPAVPEPTTMLLLGSGVAMAARRRLAKRA